MRAVEKTTPYLDAKLLASPFADSEGCYQLCLRIASGGMATVYLAMYRGTDGLQRPVAVKLIHPHLAKHAEFVEMFFDEAQLAACLDHPGICSLYDFGRTRDSYFLAMEYLVGETLERIGAVLQEHDRTTTMMRTPFFVARIVADIAEALHAVHEARDEEGRPLEIVHRDVTPHNLFVLYDGSIRVTDFGIARSRDRVHQTQSGVLKGKIGYMAPEQLGQEPVDRRCDVWSVGVVLWELLANQRLFTAPNVAAMVDAVQNRSIPPPSQVNPFVPEALDEIALRALHRDTNKRYQTMRELALDLERFLSSRKDTVPAADVTEWLEGLFPGEAARRRELVSRTRGMVETSLPPAPIVHTADDDEDLSGRVTAPRVRTSPAWRQLVNEPWARGVGSGLVVLVGALALYSALAHRKEAAQREALEQSVRAPYVASAEAAAAGPAPAASAPVAEAAHAPLAEAAEAAEAPAPQAEPAPAVEPDPEVSAQDPASNADAASTPRAAKRARASGDAVEGAAARAKPKPAAPPAMAPVIAPAPARGQVFVSTSAPAEVFYRGKRVGRTPLGISLPVGAQQLEVKPMSGAAPELVAVDVQQGVVAMKHIALPGAP